MSEENDLTAIFDEVERLIDQDKIAEAIELLEKQVSHYENEVTFLNFIAKIYHLTGNSQLTINYLIRSIEINPENLETLELLGDAYYSLKNWNQALISWKKICELDPKRYLLWNKIGDLYYEIGEYFDATKAFTNFLEYEENIDVYSILSTIYKKMGNEIESWNNLMKAEQLDPKNEKILMQIGDTYLDLDNYDRAEDYFRSVTKINEENLQAWFQLGKTLEAKQDFIQAIDSFSKVIELDPDNVLGFFNLANIYASLANIEEAIRYYEECLSRDSSFLEASMSLASLSWASKDYDKANAYLEDALRYNKAEARLYRMLGDISEDLGEEEKALDYWEKALELEEG
ncbi:MAG: tetratricopeptide repeat protein [Candidatus Heimdallarchaeaceae archaeon]